MLGHHSVHGKSIMQCVTSVLPRDEEFSTATVMAALEALDPRRNWHRKSIDDVFTKLRSRNIIRRLTRCTRNEPATYVRVESPATTPPPETEENVAKVLRAVVTRPMTTAEACVAVIESGYRPELPKTLLRKYVARELLKGFRRDGNRWAVDARSTLHAIDERPQQEAGAPRQIRLELAEALPGLVRREPVVKKTTRPATRPTPSAAPENPR